MEETYPITDLCAAFDVSRAGFYCWRQRGPRERDRTDEALSAQIDVRFVRHRRTYGRAVKQLCSWGLPPSPDNCST